MWSKRCTETGNHEASALLLEYGKDFPPADPVKEAEKGIKAIEREAKAMETYRRTGILTTALAKKEWVYGTGGKGGLTLNRWKGKGTELTTPKGIGRKPVTKIGENAFFKRNVTRVTIPATVRDISTAAFRNCPRLTIRAPAGSYAETFAKENGIPFKAC